MDETGRYLKHACLVWEKLRVLYNVLFVFGVLARYWMMGKPMHARFEDIIPILIPGAIFMNACYCFGPLVEICVRVLLGRCIGSTRYVLFAAGLPVTAAFICLWYHG